MLKAQWHHSQQLLAHGQKALLSHVHVPHAPHLPASVAGGASSLASWWRGAGVGKAGGMGHGHEGGEEEEGEEDEGAEDEGEEEGGEDGQMRRRRRRGGRHHHYAPRYARTRLCIEARPDRPPQQHQPHTNHPNPNHDPTNQPIKRREEPRDVRAHKSLRRWVVALLIFYGLLMLMSLPGSRRRFQVRPSPPPHFFVCLLCL